MKTLILGDIHIGAGLNFGKIDQQSGLNTRLLDYCATLDSVIDFISQNKIQRLVMLGDIFETRNPHPNQVYLFYLRLKKLSDAGVDTNIIMGNHDYIKTKTISSSLDPIKALNIPNVTVFTDIAARQYDDINIIMMPYRNRQSMDRYTNEEAVIDLRGIVSRLYSELDQTRPTILCGHYMLEGTIQSDVGDYGINEFSLPLDMFGDFDATIMGHIHRPSVLRKQPPIIYSGSMECRDFTEKDHKKIFLVYDSTADRSKALSFYPIKTRAFVDFDLDLSSDGADDLTPAILQAVAAQSVADAIVRVTVKAPEIKAKSVDMEQVKQMLYKNGVNLIASTSIIPTITRQLRYKQVADSTDDYSAFKAYVEAQKDVEVGVLDLAAAIIYNSEQ